MTAKKIVIEKVEAIPFSIPLRIHSRWGAAGRRTAQDHVVVRVTSASGAVGTAEATPRPTIYGETQKSIVHIIEQHFAPMVTGMDATDSASYWEKFDTIQWNPTAKGAIDIAIHDLVAQELGLPLADLLGGSAARPVPISYMVALGDVDSLIREAMDVHEKYGVNAFKVKAGADPAQDLVRVRELRKALPDALIYIDANQLYTAEVAIRTLNAMLEYDLAMVEEPLPVHLGRERRRVAEAVPVPYLGDDCVATLADVHRELEIGAIGVMGIKTPRTGIVKSLKVLHAAEVFGMPVWLGSQGVSGIGTMGSAHFYAGAGAERIPYPADLGNFLKQEDDLLETPIDLRDGKIHLPQQPGMGSKVSEEKLAKFRIDR